MIYFERDEKKVKFVIEPMIKSLEKNPEVKGKPIRARAAITNV